MGNLKFALGEGREGRKGDHGKWSWRENISPYFVS